MVDVRLVDFDDVGMVELLLNLKLLLKACWIFDLFFIDILYATVRLVLLVLLLFAVGCPASTIRTLTKNFFRKDPIVSDRSRGIVLLRENMAKPWLLFSWVS